MVSLGVEELIGIVNLATVQEYGSNISTCSLGHICLSWMTSVCVSPLPTIREQLKEAEIMH